MKILELTTYSAGGCGVFARVKQESELLVKRGYKVMIFSSNFEKGSNKIMPAEDKVENVQIKRFPAKKLGGESYMTWNFEEEALKFKPDLIIAHCYRHTHTHLALEIGKKVGAKVILVSHAPFAREKNRGLIGNIAVNLYDNLFGKRKIKKFDKIFAITKWEMPYLEELGVNKENIVYVPNGVNDNFFEKVAEKYEKNILYMGRISEIKQLETVIRALPMIKNNMKFRIYGPAELAYLEYLEELAENLKVTDRLEVVKESYDKEKQIKELDKNLIFVLPSKSEGMPQTLIEAMARERIVIGSDNLGNKDLIKDGKNGFLFKNGDAKDLANKINKLLSMNKKEIDKIRKNARKSVEQFKWSKIIDKIEKLIKN